MPNYSQLRQRALHAAFEASKAILDIYRLPFTSEKKTDGSPVTEADLKANAIIEDILRPSNFPFFSEESLQASYDERRHWKIYWLVDPLDGTKEFVSRNGEFTVNIALIQQNKPVLGVISAPALGKAWSASTREGLFTHQNIFDRQDAPAVGPIKNRDGMSQRGLRVVISRSHADTATQAAMDRLRQSYDDVSCISRGSSLKLCEIAMGTADVYPRYAPTHEWDIAAGHALVAASGGKLLNALTGEAITYNKPNTLNPSFVAVRKGLTDDLLRQFLL